MLVKLYDLPSRPALLQGPIEYRRALVPELHLVQAWVREHFSEYWASEVGVSFSRQPVNCWIAIEQGKLLGFACYETTAKGFFGPTGVAEIARGRGIGKQLLLQALHSLQDEGYAYGIIGGVGPAEFYTKAVGAVLIPDSKPGIYRGLLRE